MAICLKELRTWETVSDGIAHRNKCWSQLSDVGLMLFRVSAQNPDSTRDKVLRKTRMQKEKNIQKKESNKC